MIGDDMYVLYSMIAIVGSILLLELYGSTK